MSNGTDAVDPDRSAQPAISGVVLATCTNCGDPIKWVRLSWVHTDRIGFENFGPPCDWQPVAEP